MRLSKYIFYRNLQTVGLLEGNASNLPPLRREKSSASIGCCAMCVVSQQCEGHNIFGISSSNET